MIQPHRGADDAGADGIHSDLILGKFLSHRLGDPDRGEFRAAIGGHVRHALLSRNRRRVNDAGIVGSQQVRNSGLRHQENTLGVNGKNPIPGRFTEFCNGAGVNDPGIVHQQVELAKGLDGFLNGLLTRCVIGDIDRAYRERAGCYRRAASRSVAPARYRSIVRVHSSRLGPPQDLRP